MTEISTQTETDTEVRVPRLWNVLLHNDDFTPIKFVVGILILIFNKTETEALSIALQVHEEGSSVIGVYPKDVAYTKCNRAIVMAEEEGHPLRVEPEVSA